MPGQQLVVPGDSPVVQADRIPVVGGTGAGQAFPVVVVVLGIEVAASDQASVAYQVVVAVAGQGTGDAFAGVVASVLVALGVAQVMVAYLQTWVAYLLVDAAWVAWRVVQASVASLVLQGDPLVAFVVVVVVGASK